MRALLFVLALGGVAQADGPKGFTSYPGSRQLCYQHVSGNTMHIMWSTHATKDALAKVVAHYEKALGKKATDDGNGAKKIEADADRHITIYPAAANDKHPSCDKKPTAAEKTIVMLSTATR